MTDIAGDLHFKLLQPAEYFEDQLKRGRQDDGKRRVNEFRSTSVQVRLISSANGSALVRHGGTVVLATVKGEIKEKCGRTASEGTSDQDMKKRGHVLVCIDSQSGIGETGKEFDKIRCILQRIVDAGCIFDLSDLCVTDDGKVFWALHIDVSCLNCDGALLDSCLLALTTAIVSTKLPVVTALTDESDDNGQVLTYKIENRCRSIKTRSVLPVVACTYLFNNGPDSRLSFTRDTSSKPVIVFDPASDAISLFPNELLSMVVVVDKDNPDEEQICSFYKWGGSSINEDTLAACLKATGERRKVLLKLVSDEFLKSESKAMST